MLLLPTNLLRGEPPSPDMLQDGDKLGFGQIALAVAQAQPLADTAQDVGLGWAARLARRLASRGNIFDAFALGFRDDRAMADAKVRRKLLSLGKI